MSEITIRKGERKDIPAMMDLVIELAEYENGLDQVQNTTAQMELDGFGPDPIFEFIVAENEGNVVGISVYYFRFSTWKGKRIYLEDLVVRESSRGMGIGKLLFDATIEIGKERECTGMMWQVLDWNDPAINFYKKYKTELDNGWINCNLEF